MGIKQLLERAELAQTLKLIDRIESSSMQPNKKFDLVKARGDEALRKKRYGEAALSYEKAIGIANSQVWWSGFLDADGFVRSDLLRISETGIVFAGEMGYHRESTGYDRFWIGEMRSLMVKISESPQLLEAVGKRNPKLGDKVKMLKTEIDDAIRIARRE